MQPEFRSKILRWISSIKSCLNCSTTWTRPWRKAKAGKLCLKSSMTWFNIPGSTSALKPSCKSIITGSKHPKATTSGSHCTNLQIAGKVFIRRFQLKPGNTWFLKSLARWPHQGSWSKVRFLFQTKRDYLNFQNNNDTSAATQIPLARIYFPRRRYLAFGYNRLYR